MWASVEQVEQSVHAVEVKLEVEFDVEFHDVFLGKS
jgi:hypothetical protein